MARIFLKTRRTVVFYVPAIVFMLAFAAGTQACKKKAGEPPSKKEAVSETKISPDQSLTGRKETLIMTCNPRDEGRLFDLKRPVMVSFARKVDPSDFSFRIKPDPEGWKMRWLGEGRGVFLDHANPFLAGTRYELELKLKAPSEKQTVRFRTFGPSSLDLIEAAGEKGQIDLDTTWTYKLQALFEREKLPKEYRSSTPIYCGTKVLTGLNKVRSRLKPETLAELEPYLVRPTNPKSIFARRLAMSNLTSLAPIRSSPGLLFAGEPLQRPTSEAANMPWCSKKDVNITVWTPIFVVRDKGTIDPCQYSASILKAIQSYHIWEGFDALLGRTPPSDARDADNGGDGTLDIYVAPPSSQFDFSDPEEPGTYLWGFCIPTGEGQTSPSYILINGSLSGDQLGSTLAHELFHSFQFAFNTDANDWWMEGSATWAENFTEPTWDLEHSWDETAFAPDEHSLISLTSEENKHEYAAYLFPFYLASKQGDQIVAKIWQNCAGSGTMDAVEKALGGEEGFEKTFKEFAYMNWSQDQDPNVDKYPEAVDVDNFHAHYFDESMPEKMPFDKNIDLPSVSAVYYLFRNEVKDRAALPHVKFDLQEFKKNPKLSVQAYIQYRTGDDKKEDWTGLEKKEFCLNDEQEDFVNIWLVLANAARRDRERPELKVTLDQEGCGMSYLDITRKEHYLSHTWGNSYDMTTTRDEDVTLRVNFDATQISMNPGKVGKEKGFPYGYTIIEGQEPKIVSHKLHKLSEGVIDGDHRRHEANGSLPKPDMPDVPTLTGTKPDKTKFSLKPYPVIIFLYDATTGKVKYVLVPDFTLKFEWDDKEGIESIFDAKPLTQGDSHEKVDVAGMQIGRMRVRKINEVTTGDGVKSFGSKGTYKHENKRSSSYELQDKSYTWQVTIRKQKSK